MITSTSNHQVKTIVQLNKKTKARRELRAFIVEGPKMVAETPRALLERVSVSEHFANEPELVLEDIQDPGNLGTMFRTGEGAGISGIIMTKGTVDLFAPKTVRATMGSIYRVPYLVTDDLGAMLGKLHAEGIHTYAAHLRGEKYYDELDLTGNCAFLIGNEGNGLKKETADLADTYLKIPMEGKLESLNAAMAAGILMYEAHRQSRQEEAARAHLV